MDFSNGQHVRLPGEEAFVIIVEAIPSADGGWHLYVGNGIGARLVSLTSGEAALVELSQVRGATNTAAIRTVGEGSRLLQDLFEPSAVEAAFETEPELQPHRNAASTATLQDLETWVKDPMDLRRIFHFLIAEKSKSAGSSTVKVQLSEEPTSFDALIDSIVVLQGIIMSRNTVPVPLAAAAVFAQTVLGESTLEGLIDNVKQLPTDERSQVNALLSLPLREIAPAPTISQLLARLLERARSPKLFARRILAEERSTLEALGWEFGVTRERIRQIVARDTEILLEALTLEEFAPLRWYLQRVRALVQTVRRVADEEFLDLVHLAEGSEIPPTGVRRLVVLLARVEEHDSWIGLTKADILETQRAVASALEQIDIVEDGFASLAADHDIGPGVLRAAADAARIGRWISDTCFVRWGGSAANKAQTVLRLALTPLTPDEIAEYCDDGTTVRNLANQLGGSQRFVRVDKMNRFALVEWGMEEYSGIAEEIKERIERGRGQASKAAIIHEFTNSFGVSESSINSYLAGPLFHLDGDAITLAKAPGERFSPKHPGRFTSAVSTAYGWGQQMTVTADHLRGYSFVGNFHVAYANECRPGDSLKVPIVVNDQPTGTQGSLIWRFTSPGLDIGRCREALSVAGVEEGSRITIVPSKTGIWIITLKDADVDPELQSTATDDSVVDDAIVSFFG